MGRRTALRFDAVRSAWIAAALSALLSLACAPVWSQSGAVPKTAEAGPKWSELSPAQRTSLKPLERDWSRIEPDRKQKWIEIAQRMPSMPPAERERVQERMTDWARMSPQQRGQTRLGYQEAKQVAPEDRQARWEQYQALTAEQKRQLQARAATPVPPAGAKPGAPVPPRTDRADRPQAKSNIVPNPAYAAPPKQIGPTVVQAQPGATTSLISKRATPPAHQQAGLPKIAATPGLVDKTTLLPQRGAQGAATRSAAASAPNTRP
ncbi:MAG TPA: DUF3106 domain-containing protein [Albitalea sp.]|uniref:DUF3106 domain-containing protein n=1 Tax=Piscinibacter sp. TaxID=1903157 RepID=UPI002ED4AEC0